MSATEKNADKKPGLSWIAILASIIVLGAIGYYIAEPLFNSEPTPQELRVINSATLEDAKAALSAQDFGLANALAKQVLRKEPSNAKALLVAGEVAMKLGNVDDALETYRSIPETAKGEYVIGLWSAANICIYQGKLREAEQLFRDALRIDSVNVTANHGLGFILGIEGRRWESVPFLLEPIRQGSIAMEPLMLMATVDHRSADADELTNLARRTEPDYWVPMLGVALRKFFSEENEEAEKLVREILAHHSDLVEAHALLGKLLVQRRRVSPTEYFAWLDSLPPGADDHPMIWTVRGIWAQDHGDFEGAARCFWEAAKINPNHQNANYRLSRVLKSLGRESDAEPFGTRADLLEKLLTEMYPLYGDREKYPDPKRMLRVARLCSQLGRYWEAWAWYNLVKRIDPENAEVNKEGQRLQALTSSNPPQVVPDAMPTARIDLSALPLPKRVAIAQADTQSDSQQWSRARMADIAQEVGLDFAYNNGDDPDVPGLKLCQELGGAMAVIDYDLDGWPDIYAAQGGPWPADPTQTEYRDRLYRNLGNGKFMDVTEQANLGDNLYSHGAAIGDFDNDGWPDIFVANLGANQLYHNQGDGTFRNVTQHAGIRGERWSTSGAIADLNGDRLPDLYISNYLAGRKALTTDCYKAGEPRACPPGEFPGEIDRLYLNQGNGQFVDATQDCGIADSDGRGLGVVVADFHGQGLLSVYVSNDMSPNFFFVNEAAARGDPLQFTDRALLIGVAYGPDGDAQASMGIAAGDGDGDGLIDLFLTHFYNQSNTYYRQISPDFFEDSTQELGLREPSLPVLAFGTQFIDFENDGRLDLVLACGHIEDYRLVGEPFMMKPQAYANRNNKRFELLNPESIGEFFANKYLGRSLALIDWDRDGRQDLAMLHLYGPSSFLANRSQQPGHFLQMHLRGVESERDAIGTTVTAHIGSRTLVRQLMAGNGFQCTNQKVVHFGVDRATQIDKLVVQWPSGVLQTFENVAVDHELFLVEGSKQLVDYPGDDE